MTQILAELGAKFGFVVDQSSIDNYDKAVKKSTDETQKLDDTFTQLAKRVNDLAKDRAKAAADTRKFLASAEEVGIIKKAPDVSKALAVIGLDTKGATKALGDAKKASGDWTSTLLKMDAAVNLAARGINFARSQITSFLGDISAAGGSAGDIADMSERTGIATDTLQELGYAAQQNGGDINSVGSALKTLGQKADQASKGGKEAQKALRAVGISASALRSGSLPLDEALEKIAAKLQKMPDGAKKSALAMQLFGGAGEKLIPFLNIGGDGIVKFREEARRLGVVLGEDGIKGLDAFDDQSAKLSTTLKALKTQAISAIIPELSKLASKFQEWLSENRVKIVEQLTSAFNGMVSAVRILASLIEPMIPLFVIIADNMDTVAAAVGGITTALIAHNVWLAITTAGSKAAAAAAIVAWLAVAWPFIALGAAVAAIIRFWPQIKAGAVTAARAVGSAFGTVGSAVKRAWQAVVDWVESKIKWAVDTIGWIKRKWEAVKDGITYSDDEWDVAKDLVKGNAPSSGTTVRSSSSSTATTRIDVNSPITVTVGKDAQVGEASTQLNKELESFWNRKMRQER